MIYCGPSKSRSRTVLIRSSLGPFCPTKEPTAITNRKHLTGDLKTRFFATSVSEGTKSGKAAAAPQMLTAKKIDHIVQLPTLVVDNATMTTAPHHLVQLTWPRQTDTEGPIHFSGHSIPKGHDDTQLFCVSMSLGTVTHLQPPPRVDDVYE